MTDRQSLGAALMSAGAIVGYIAILIGLCAALDSGAPLGIGGPVALLGFGAWLYFGDTETKGEG